MKLRAVLALAVAIFGAALFVPAGAATAYPPNICPSISVSTTHPLPGERIAVAGVNFTPNSSVRLVLHTPTQLLASVTTNSGGSFSTEVKLPNGVVGDHLLQANPHTARCPASAMLHIQAAGTSGQHGGTSFTGVDVLLLLLAAAVLIAIGVVVNRGGKRRNSVQSTH